MLKPISLSREKGKIIYTEFCEMRTIAISYRTISELGGLIFVDLKIPSSHEDFALQQYIQVYEEDSLLPF